NFNSNFNSNFDTSIADSFLNARFDEIVPNLGISNRGAALSVTVNADLTALLTSFGETLNYTTHGSLADDLSQYSFDEIVANCARARLSIANRVLFVPPFSMLTDIRNSGKTWIRSDGTNIVQYNLLTAWLNACEDRAVKVILVAQLQT